MIGLFLSQEEQIRRVRGYSLTQELGEEWSELVPGPRLACLTLPNRPQALNQLELAVCPMEPHRAACDPGSGSARQWLGQAVVTRMAVGALPSGGPRAPDWRYGSPRLAPRARHPHQDPLHRTQRSPGLRTCHTLYPPSPAGPRSEPLGTISAQPLEQGTTGFSKRLGAGSPSWVTLPRTRPALGGKPLLGWSANDASAPAGAHAPCHCSQGDFPKPRTKDVGCGHV